jgi:hypothetical protein
MLSFPLDFLASFPGWTTEFTPQWRQEQSRSANGKTYVKDLGSPLWTATWQSRGMSANELDTWRARLDALENGATTFIASPMSRCYPIAYPNGSWPTGSAFSGVCKLDSMSSGRAVALKGLPAGYQLSVGDFIQIGSADLHRVREAATASAGGVTGQFEIRPYLWPTALVNADVRLVRPSCVMSLVPDSLSSPADMATGRGPITFKGMEAR